jgi:hypothetical protein
LQSPIGARAAGTGFLRARRPSTPAMRPRLRHLSRRAILPKGVWGENDRPLVSRVTNVEMPADSCDRIATLAGRRMLRSQSRRLVTVEVVGKGSPCSVVRSGLSAGFRHFRSQFVRLAEFRRWGCGVQIGRRLGPCRWYSRALAALRRPGLVGDRSLRLERAATVYHSRSRRRLWRGFRPLRAMGIRDRSQLDKLVG